MKTPPRTLRAKLLPKAPVFDAPKLTVPREIRTPRPEQPDVAPPKIEVNHFTPAVVKQVTGGARPTLIVHTGEFGSSATPTVNAPIQKVQTGGFGDPNGLKGEGKPNAHLVAASTGSFDLPPGAGNGNGAGGAKGIKGTIASAGFRQRNCTGRTGRRPQQRSRSYVSRPRAFRLSNSARVPATAAAGGKRTCDDPCGNHLQAQSGLH